MRIDKTPIINAKKLMINQHSLFHTSLMENTVAFSLNSVMPFMAKTIRIQKFRLYQVYPCDWLGPAAALSASLTPSSSSAFGISKISENKAGSRRRGQFSLHQPNST